MSSPLARMTGFLQRPVGLPHLAFVVLACLAMLEAGSIPNGRTWGILGAMFSLGACGVYWLVRLSSHVGRSRRAAPAERAPFAWARWLAAPAAVGVTAVLMIAGVPLQLRFALSHDALDRLAQTVRAESPEPPEGDERARHQPARAGLFEIHHVVRMGGGGMRLRVAGSGFLDQGGFAFIPSRRPPHDLYDFERFDGSWYIWFDDF